MLNFMLRSDNERCELPIRILVYPRKPTFLLEGFGSALADLERKGIKTKQRIFQGALPTYVDVAQLRLITLLHVQKILCSVFMF